MGVTRKRDFVTRARDFAIVTLIAVLAAFFLAPIASSGFLGDDQFNSTVNGMLAIKHESLLSLVWNTTLSFFRETARFIIFGHLEWYGTFHLIPNLVAYKTLQIFALLLDGVLLSVLLRELKVDLAFIALTMIFVLGSIQFHGHYDGYLGFSAIEEYLLALTLGSWICFVRWINHRAPLFGIASFVLYVIAVLSYETCYPFAVGHLILAFELGGLRAWRRALPFIAISCLAFATLAEARRLFPQQETAIYFLRLNPVEVCRTFVNEVTASLPLMFLFFHSGYDTGSAAFWSVVPFWLLIAVAAVTLVLMYTVLTSLAARQRRLPYIALLGAVLWLPPAFLISPIPRYQREVSFGFGYVVMVIGGFGAALVLASAVAKVAQYCPSSARKVLAAVGACCAAVVAVLSFETNQMTLAAYETERIAQINLTVAFEHGIAQSVPDGADLWVDTKAQLFDRPTKSRVFLSDARFFVEEHAHRNVNVYPSAETPAEISCSGSRCSLHGDIFVLRDEPLDARNGYSILGHVARVTQEPDDPEAPVIDHVRIFAHGQSLADLQRTNRLALRFECIGSSRIRTMSIDGVFHAGERIIDLAMDCPVDVRNVALVSQPN